MIPTNQEWTIVFSKDNRSWGSFFYNEMADAARIKVKPEVATMQEWLSYSFENPREDKVDLVMHWEKLKVRIPIAINLSETIVASMKQELKGAAGVGWQGYNQLATYMVDKNHDLNEALKMAEKSI
jgi:hypothetical protein